MGATRVQAETFPFAVPPEEAERRCRRALVENWVGRTTAAFRLPPSRLALNPGDVLRAADDVEALPPESPLAEVLSDYAAMRDQARACRMR